MAHRIHPLLGRTLFAVAIALCGALGCGADEPGTGSLDTERRAGESLSAGQIASVVSTLNQGEIKQAQVALGRLEDKDVRAYAELIIREHQASEKRLETLRAQLGVAKEESDLQEETDLLERNMVRHIEREIPSLADQTYLEVQMFMHRKSVSIVSQQLLPAAKQPEMQVYLEGLREMLEMHLGRATILRKRYPATTPN